jgi:NAD dependent epimerase/dehydratase family enzyme
MHLILTGATGMVGSAVLDTMISNSAVTRVSILSRRPVAMAEGHEKVKVILQEDFKKYESKVLDELKDANGCVWALGVSQNAVDKQ